MCPLNGTVRSEGRRRPTSTLRVVDFPEPFGALIVRRDALGEVGNGMLAFVEQPQAATP